MTCFVIQPFGKKIDSSGTEVDNDEVYDALMTLSTIKPSMPIHVSRADTGTISRADLHEHVVTRLRRSDFCIADLTGQNPNVLYETGIAKGFGIAVVLICQDRKDVPTDLAGYITVRYSPGRLGELPGAIAQHLDMIREEVAARRHRHAAQIDYFATRNEANIRARILAATERIDILQTNLVTVATDYLQQLVERMNQRPSLQLRLLTLNPQSVFVNYRGGQVGFADNIALYREELDTNLKSVRFALHKFEDRVQIRIYDDFPTQIAFYFDDEILVCVVSATGRSRDNCAFLLDARLSGAQHSFSAHFDYLWSDKKSKPYPLPQ
ncbi:MAG TPA: hypothetical protein VF092_00825 [Longimicrobium sp.]